jgi:hypothetical protein
VKTPIKSRSRVSVIGVAIRQRARRQGSGRSMPDNSKVFFFIPRHPDRLWGPTRFLLNEYTGLISGVKRPGREGDRSPPSSGKGKNEWSCTSIPAICLHDSQRYSFTLFFLLNPMILRGMYCAQLKGMEYRASRRHL